MFLTKEITTSLIFLVFLLAKSIAQENEINQKVRKQATVGTCETACSLRIDESFDYTTSLHQTTTGNHDALVQRVSTIENEFYETVGRLNIFMERLNKLEAYFNGNVTNLNNKIIDETQAISEFTNFEFDAIRRDYTAKFNNLTADVNIIKNGGGGGGNGDGYFNLTKRIDNLESGKISNLTADNGIWRKNFRLINATFVKIKSSCQCKL